MTEAEKREIVDLIKGMSPEELSVVVSMLDTSVLHVELMNRALNNEIALKKIKECVEDYA